jgi:hypothetical protein
MAARKALVVGANGKPQQLQAGDTLAGAGGGSVVPETVTIDFGSTGVFGKTGSVALAGAVIGESVIMKAAPAGIPVDDEAEMDGLLCTGKVTVTDFLDYSIMAIPGPVRGTRLFNLIKG